MPMNSNQYLYDGNKAIPLQSLPPEAWTVHSGPGTPTSVETAYAAVAFLYRAIEIRANTLSTLPWAISRGDTELWTNEAQEVPPELEPIANLVDLIWQTEAALCLGSQAYWHKLRNNAAMLEVRWLTPSSMTPVWDAQEGLVAFERRIGTKVFRLPAEDVVFTWLRGQHETEPRPAPAMAALAAANVVLNTDEFAAQFFKRGAIKATLLTVPASTTPQAKKELKAWWKRFFQGIGNAYESAVINAEAVTPVAVGEGVSELSDSALTQEKREDIATGIGVPHSLVLSNAANRSVSEQDYLNLYTLTVVPEARQIERQLNAQLFEPQGLRFTFKPQELSVFQEDEEQRASSLEAYVRAGYTLSVASEILGVTLPDGMQYADLDETVPEPEPVPPQLQFGPEPVDEERVEEIRKFTKWASGKRDPDPDKFKSEILTRADKLALLEGSTAADAPFPATDWADYP